MEPKIIVIPLSEEDISSEEKVLQLMKLSSHNKCSLFLLNNSYEEHLFWAGDDGYCLKMKPVFAHDYIPENLANFQIAILTPQCFFIYRKELYFLMNTETGMQITKVSVFNFWKEIEITYNISDCTAYICKAFHITDSKKNAYKLIGYCWRVVKDSYIYTFPFFPEDYIAIKQIPHTELNFECLEEGEKFFHRNQLWTVHKDEKHFFANPHCLKLSLG